MAFSPVKRRLLCTGRAVVCVRVFACCFELRNLAALCFCAPPLFVSPRPFANKGKCSLRFSPLFTQVDMNDCGHKGSETGRSHFLLTLHCTCSDSHVMTLFKLKLLIKCQPTTNRVVVGWDRFKNKRIFGPPAHFLIRHLIELQVVYIRQLPWGGPGSCTTLIQSFLNKQMFCKSERDLLTIATHP